MILLVIIICSGYNRKGIDKMDCDFSLSFQMTFNSSVIEILGV